MITLQRRIFSLTAASPSGGAVIFVLQPVFPPFHIYIFPLFISFPAILSAVPYFHIIIFPARSRPSYISIINILPHCPFGSHIYFHLISSPPPFPPSYIFIYYIPRRLLTVIYFHLISSPPPLGCHIYFRIIISPAAPAPADNPSIIYPPPRRWIQFFLVFILYGRPCTPICGGRSVCGRENFSVSALRNAFRARSLDVFGMLGDPVPRVVKGGR